MAAPTGTRLWESINEDGGCSLPRLVHNIERSIKGQLKDYESFLIIAVRAVAPPVKNFSHFINQVFTHT